MAALHAVFLGWAIISGSTRHYQENPEARALGYLAREVPAWSAQNKCFSCHNNGDAARALFTAHQLSFPVPPESIKDTVEWLSRPEQWDKNGGDGPASDRRLARIQFTAALESAVAGSLVNDTGALIRAAQQIAQDQEPDGSWLKEDAAALGSPATYGRALATTMARNGLRAADGDRFAPQIERAGEWLRRAATENIVDSAAILLAAGKSSDAAWQEPRKRALEQIRKGQSDDGGWGPFVTAPPEAFDTALVVLALCELGDSAEVDRMMRRGRAFLVANQQADGSWIETTRPPGAESYAQRLSTTGWATMALLRTREQK
jgi:hypothetical protein